MGLHLTHLDPRNGWRLRQIITIPPQKALARPTEVLARSTPQASRKHVPSLSVIGRGWRPPSAHCCSPPPHPPSCLTPPSEHAITHICSLGTDNPTVALRAALGAPERVLHIVVKDIPEANLATYFPQIIAFIHAARAAGGSVYIHCHSGVSRSCTSVVAYLMVRLSDGWRGAVVVVTLVVCGGCDVS